MEAEPQRPRGGNNDLSALNAAIDDIETLNLAKEPPSITPVKAAFHSTGVILAMIREEMINRVGYVELGLACADVCTALDGVLDGRGLSDLNSSASEAITIAVATIKRKIVKRGKYNLICRRLFVLGNIHRSKGETEKAIHQYEVALEIASSSNWHGVLFQIHNDLAGLFRDEGRFDDAHVHIERAKSHTVDSSYNLGCATEQQAWIWYKQHRFEEATSEALRAAEVFEKLGAAKDLESCRKLFQRIEKKLNNPTTSGQSGLNFKLF